ncbi:S1 family peptidase [Streptosporangium sp. G11]|uniref:S1 family peptidase n=1 Tax=Streptosporangium sp. G11 TaxID=3436926 RepID=UPI003EBA2C21
MLITHRAGKQHAFALLTSAVAVTAMSLSPASAASAVDRPLAALTDTAIPARPPESAVKEIEAINRLMFDNPVQWAGVWYDKTSGRVVAAVPPGASEQTRASARSALGSTGPVVEAARSFADLARLSDAIISRGTVASVPIVTTGLDWEHNTVVVGLTTITDDARAALAADYGDAVTVRQAPQAPQADDGPDRYRDRYPYWGGSAWAAPYAGSRRCSTAFAMKRPDSSKHFLVTAGHCNSPDAQNAATMNTARDSWNNFIGTSKGYQNSLCASTGNSCDIGSTKYGDISVIRVNGIEGRIYSGGVYTTASQAVTDTMTSPPAMGESLCISGAQSGTTCGYYVTNNFTSVRYSNGQVMSPVVETNGTGNSCTSGGDSGGAVYRQLTSGVRAAGIHSGTGVGCIEWFTSIYYAQKLFYAVTVTS